MKHSRYPLSLLVPRLFAMAAMVFVFGVPSAAQSQTILFSDNFEADTNGLLNGWIMSTPLGTTIQPVLGSSSNGSGANSMVLQIADYTGTGSWNAAFSFPKQFAGTLVQVNYKVQFLQPPSGLQNSDVRTSMLLSGAPGLTYTRISTGGSGFTHYNDTVTPATFDPTGVSSIIKGDWYQVTEIVDLSTQSYNWSIANLNSNAVGQSGSGVGYFYNPGSAEDTYGIVAVSNGGITNFDDFVVSVVPEPSVISYGIFGVVVILVGNRLRRSYATGKMAVE